MGKERPYNHSYAESRAQFCEAADDARFALASHFHPTLKGPNGEHLAIDIARLNPPGSGATKFLLNVSGVHGAEGYIGSAVQTRLLRRGDFSNLPKDVGIVLVHALNPWGMAHFTRVTEGNRDLNRNFIYYRNPNSELPAEDPLAAVVHKAFVALPRDEAERREQRNLQKDFWRRHSKQEYQQALTGGQYTNPDGVCFGGRELGWSGRIWRDEVIPPLRGQEEVVVADFHSGLGRRGRIEIISSNLVGSPQYKRTQEIWGEEAITSPETGNSSTANLVGTLASTVYIVPAVTMEFGTRPFMPTVNKALIESNRSVVDGFKDEALAFNARKLMKKAFAPDDPAWLAAALPQGVNSIERVLATWRREANL